MPPPPLLCQVLDAICSNPADRTDVTLLFANMTEEDVILKKELDALADRNPHVKVIQPAGLCST